MYYNYTQILNTINENIQSLTTAVYVVGALISSLLLYRSFRK